MTLARPGQITQVEIAANDAGLLPGHQARAATLSDTAKLLRIPGMGPINLIKFLRENKVLNSTNVPKQKFIDLGYFQLVQREITIPGGMVKLTMTTRVRPKGVEFIRRLAAEELPVEDEVVFCDGPECSPDYDYEEEGRCFS